MRNSAFLVPSSRSVRLLSAGVAALALAACSNDVSRFNGDANNNPYRSQSNDVTYSSGARSGAPTAQIESRPLDQPSYNGGGAPVYGPQVYGQNSQPQAQPQHPPAPQYQPQSAPQYRPQPSYQQQSNYAPRSVPAAPAPRYTAAETTGSLHGQKTVVTLKRGETIHTLASRYGVTTAAILRENNFADAARVRPGARIVIPTRSEARTAGATHGSTHVVASGETLYSLARRYHVSHVQIARANGISETTSLRVGQRMTIPGTSVAAAPRQAEAAPAAAPVPAQKKLAQTPIAGPVDNVATVKPIAPTEAEPAKSASSNSALAFRWPVKGRVISAYGSKPNGQQNDGINIAVPENTGVKAAEEGTVAYAGNELKGYGNLVLVRHANGYVTAYAHNSEILVHRGETVKRGQVIAKAGQTGGVASPQVHFEIRKGSNPVDPSKYLTSL